MVTVPLIALAIPSVVIGGIYVGPMLFGDFFADAIHVLPEHDTLAELGHHYHGVWSFVVHGLQGPAVWLALLGVLTAWYLYMRRPDLPARFAERLRPVHAVLEHKYGFDEFNETAFGGGARGLGRLLWKVGDVRLIDGLMVNGVARSVGWMAGRFRHVQSGFLYHYAFAMMLGLLGLFILFVL